MTDALLTANFYELKERVYYLEQKIKHMADIGDLVEVEWCLHGDVYETRNVEIKRIVKKNS